MITKQQFDDWKENPVTQSFFNFVKYNLVQSRINMFELLRTKMDNPNVDLNKVRDIYASNEEIFGTLLNLEAGNLNSAEEIDKKLKQTYKKELLEVLNVE